ncbi:MAG: PspC domain-containing protein [Prevotella sp.]|jgi:phage shock protein PspC (stress-responsive transcriptional regulator)|nr:PspC domain-containing protein [Prevotella sp.]
MKKLAKSSKDVNISGVCAGIAEYSKINSTWIRIIFVLVTILTGCIIGIITYILLGRIIPENPLRDSRVQFERIQEKKYLNEFLTIPHG